MRILGSSVLYIPKQYLHQVNLVQTSFMTLSMHCVQGFHIKYPSVIEQRWEKYFLSTTEFSAILYHFFVVFQELIINPVFCFFSK